MNTAKHHETWVELQTLRHKDGHTLTSLAVAAGMALGYLSDLEAGKREPNPRVIKRLATALNVPVSMLEKVRRAEVA